MVDWLFLPQNFGPVSSSLGGETGSETSHLVKLSLPDIFKFRIKLMFPLLIKSSQEHPNANSQHKKEICRDTRHPRSLNDSKENSKRAYLRVKVLKTESKRTSESEETDTNFICFKRFASESFGNMYDRYSSTKPQCVLL